MRSVARRTDALRGVDDGEREMAAEQLAQLRAVTAPRGGQRRGLALLTGEGGEARVAPSDVAVDGGDNTVPRRRLRRVGRGIARRDSRDAGLGDARPRAGAKPT
jgi:hypothetical protein